MGLFKKGVNIGKIIANRVKDFPVCEKEPKKKLARWITCPDFSVKLPKAINKEEKERNYNFSITIFSEHRDELEEMLDYMIHCGKEDIKAEGNKFFWLHAVNYSIQHKMLFQATLKYIFRVEQFPEEILEGGK